MEMVKCVAPAVPTERKTSGDAVLERLRALTRVARSYRDFLLCAAGIYVFCVNRRN